jgi:hypothetical protein
MKFFYIYKATKMSTVDFRQILVMFLLLVTSASCLFLKSNELGKVRPEVGSGKVPPGMRNNAVPKKPQTGLYNATRVVTPHVPPMMNDIVTKSFEARAFLTHWETSQPVPNDIGLDTPFCGALPDDKLRWYAPLMPDKYLDFSTARNTTTDRLYHANMIYIWEICLTVTLTLYITVFCLILLMDRTGHWTKRDWQTLSAFLLFLFLQIQTKHSARTFCEAYPISGCNLSLDSSSLWLTSCSFYVLFHKWLGAQLTYRGKPDYTVYSRDEWYWLAKLLFDRYIPEHFKHAEDIWWDYTTTVDSDNRKMHCFKYGFTSSGVPVQFSVSHRNKKDIVRMVISRWARAQSHSEVQGLMGLLNKDWDKNPDIKIAKEILILGANLYLHDKAAGKVLAILSFLDRLMDIDTPRYKQLIEVLPMGRMSEMFSEKPPTVFRMGDYTPTSTVQSLADMDSVIRQIFASDTTISALKMISLLWGIIFVIPKAKLDIAFLGDLVEHSVLVKGSSLIISVYDHVVNLSTCAKEYYETGDATVWLRRHDDFGVFKAKCDNLHLKIEEYRYEEKLDSNMRMLHTDLAATITSGTKMLTTIKRSLRTALQGELTKLRMDALQLKNITRNCTQRDAPYTILVHGGPGIGKSSITGTLIEHFRQLNPRALSRKEDKPLPLLAGGVYNRNLGEAYWSCYTNSSWCVVYDDLAQKNPKVAGFETEIQEIIHVINNVTYFPEMAAVEEKGKMFVAPDFVIATTNNKGLNASAACFSSGAVLRRFPIVVTPTVRPQFRRPDGRLNEASVGDNKDIWTFKVERIVLEDNGSVTYASMLPDNVMSVSLEELLDIVRDTSIEHFTHQGASEGFTKSFGNLCHACKRLSLYCKCAPIVTSPSSLPSVPNVDIIPLADSRRINTDRLPIAQPPPDIVADYVQLPTIEVPAFPNRHHLNCPPRKPSSVATDASDSDIDPESVLCGEFVDDTGIVHVVGFFLLFACVLDISRRIYSRYLSMAYHRAYALVLYLFHDPWTACRYLITFEAGETASDAAQNYYSFVCSLGHHYNALSTRLREQIFFRPTRTRILAAVLVSAAFALMITRYFTSSELHGKIHIPEGVMEPPKHNTENVWKNTDKLDSYSLLARPNRTSKPEAFRELVHKATARFTVTSPTGTENSITGVCMFGQYWLVPKHFWLSAEKNGNNDLFIKSVTNANFSTVKTKVNCTTCHHCPDRDFTLVCAPTINHYNLCKYLTKPITKPLEIETYFVDGNVQKLGPYNLVDDSTMNATLSRVGVTDNSKKYLANIIERIGKNGYCGSPAFVAQQGLCMLLGAHVGYTQISLRGDKHVINPYPMEWITMMRDHFTQTEPLNTVCFSHVDGVPSIDISTSQGIPEITDMHAKSAIRFEGFSETPEGSSITPVCSLKISQTRFNSKVSFSRMFDFWTSRGYTTDKIPPIREKVDGIEGPVKEWRHKRTCLLTTSPHKDFFSSEILSAVTAHYYARLLNIPKQVRETVTVLTENAFLYGIDGVPFVDSLNFKTGAGYFYGSSKALVMPALLQPDGTTRHTISDVTRTRMDNFEDSASRLERPSVIFNASLKDEAVTEKKMTAGKLRVFQAICLEGLLLLRKYFLSVISIFQRFNFVTELAVGMNCFGRDWDDLHEYLFQPGWRVFCGDYSNFDQRQASSIMKCAWKILINFCRANNPGVFIALTLNVMYSLAIECCNPIVNFFGDLYIFNGYNPSGHALTVVINSIVNSLYIRVAWLDIFGNLKDFNDHVRIITYGDDNVISVHPKYQERFNQNTVSLALAKYGVIYTDAHKSAVMEPFVAEDDATFLKRSWAVDHFEGVQFYRCPIEMKTINTMLCIQKHEQDIAQDDRDASVIFSSLAEAFHHGRDFYAEHAIHCRECITQFGLDEWFRQKSGCDVFPTWEHFARKRIDESYPSRKTVEARNLASA